MQMSAATTLWIPECLVTVVIANHRETRDGIEMALKKDIGREIKILHSELQETFPSYDSAAILDIRASAQLLANDCELMLKRRGL
jgi:hypothetical protein